jgi:hypothetical protein
VDVAQAINRGEEVELRDSDVDELKQLLKDPRNRVFSFAQKQIIDFIDKVKEADKKEEDK